MDQENYENIFAQNLDSIKLKLNAYKNFLVDNLTFIVIILTIVGSIYQVLHLMSISFSLVNFFSLSQLLIDGVKIITFFFVLIVLPMIIGLNISINKSDNFIFILVILLLQIANFSLWNVEVLLYKELIMTFINSLLIALITSNYILRETKVSKLLIYLFIFYLLVMLTKSIFLLDDLTNSNKIFNFKKIEKKYEQKGKIIKDFYINDTYIFLKVQSSCKCKKKIKDKFYYATTKFEEIHIEKSEKFFE